MTEEHIHRANEVGNCFLNEFESTEVFQKLNFCLCVFRKKDEINLLLFPLTKVAPNGGLPFIMKIRNIIVDIFQMN